MASTPNPHTSPEYALYLAAQEGDTQRCRVLIAQGAGMTLDTEAGRSTALIGAARGGHADTCLALINRGADVDEQDTAGLTALHHAAWKAHTDVVEELLDAGADVGIRSSRGLSAEDFAGVSLNTSPSDKDEIKALIDSAARRQALERLAKRTQTQSDLATPEEALAARQARYGRAM